MYSLKLYQIKHLQSVNINVMTSRYVDPIGADTRGLIPAETLRVEHSYADDGRAPPTYRWSLAP